MYVDVFYYFLFKVFNSSFFLFYSWNYVFDLLLLYFFTFVVYLRTASCDVTTKNINHRPENHKKGLLNL